MPIEVSHDHVAIRAVDYAGTVEAIDRRLGFLKDNNDNVIELGSPLG